MTYTQSRAVVMGAGMAGLLAANALADHFEEVVVIERDILPDAPESRRGATQGRHAHALLARGQLALEAAFPGFTADIADAGARTGDMLEVSRLYFSGHRLHPTTTGLTVISASRALIEHQVRSRVRDRPEITIVDQCDVAGIVATPNADQITGIRLLRRADGSAEEIMHTDLVVDATGRSGRTTTWLADLGIAPPDEERVLVDVSYATRRYRMGAEALDGDVAVIIAPTLANPRMGGLALLEDDTAMLTVAGMCGDRPPLDADGFEGFVRSLSRSDIADGIEGARPLDDPVPHRFPASCWRRYDTMDLPDGLVIVGDAVCSVNPIYGQGMSIAALEADALGRLLARSGRFRPRRFQRRIARIIRPAWQMAAGADLQFPAVPGDRGIAQRLLGDYVARLHAAAAQDPRLSAAFVRVSGLVDPPSALMRPSIARRVLRGSR